MEIGAGTSVRQGSQETQRPCHPVNFHAHRQRSTYRGKLVALNPLITVALLQGGRLEGAHQGRLVVQNRESVDHPAVDFGERDDAVAVHVQRLPQLLQLILMEKSMNCMFLGGL